jgi:hypothetical protein
MILVLVSLAVSVIILAAGLLAYRFTPVTESQDQGASSPGAKGKTRPPMAKAKSGGTTKTTQVIDKGRLGGPGHLGYRRSRTKLGDQELGTMTRSEGN